MKFCIFGAGAIGGYLGAGLALAGKDVTLIARGPHLAAMQKTGLKLQIAGEERIARPTCVADARDRKSTRLNSSHIQKSRMPSSA